MRKRCESLLLTGIVFLALGSTARAEFRLEKELKLDPGGRFVLESDSGSARVTGSAQSGAHVVITANRDDVESWLEFSFEDGPGTARVTARRKHNFSWHKNLSLRYEVRVPATTRLELRTGGGGIAIEGLRGDSNLDTSGGSIEVSSLAGRLTAHTSGGDIRLRQVDGDAGIETSGGGIDVDSLNGSLRAHTSGGPIRIEGVNGRVEAHTSGGSVRATFDRGNAHGGVLETSGGSIEVRLDPNANLNLDASTSGGSVRTDLPIRVVGRIAGSSLQGTLGSGGETLRLHTSGGSIHIESR